MGSVEDMAVSAMGKDKSGLSGGEAYHRVRFAVRGVYDPDHIGPPQYVQRWTAEAVRPDRYVRDP